MNKQSTFCAEVLERIRNDGDSEYDRPNLCPARKRCKPQFHMTYKNGFLCSGINWIRKDMDIVRLCSVRNGILSHTRLTIPEAIHIVEALLEPVDTFQMHMDSEYKEMLNNMNGRSDV